jgi:biotin carboxylase
MARPDGGVTLVECGARLGGLMAELAEHALGIDLIEVQLRIALGDSITDELVAPRFERAVAIRFLTAEPGPLPAGRVTRIGPLDRVLASPGVVHAETYLEVGETINPVTRITDRRGLVIAVGETTAEALEKAEAGAALVEVEVEAA